MKEVKRKKEREQKEYVGPWAGWEGEKIETVGPTKEEYEEQEEGGGAPLNKKQRKQVIKDSGKAEVGFGEEKSTFHGTALSFFSLSLASFYSLAHSLVPLSRALPLSQAKNYTIISDVPTFTFQPTSTSISNLQNQVYKNVSYLKKWFILGQDIRKESVGSNCSLVRVI